MSRRTMTGIHHGRLYNETEEQFTLSQKSILSEYHILVMEKGLGDFPVQYPENSSWGWGSLTDE